MEAIFLDEKTRYPASYPKTGTATSRVCIGNESFSGGKQLLWGFKLSGYNEISAAGLPCVVLTTCLPRLANVVSTFALFGNSQDQRRLISHPRTNQRMRNLGFSSYNTTGFPKQWPLWEQTLVPWTRCGTHRAAAPGWNNLLHATSPPQHLQDLTTGKQQPSKKFTEARFVFIHAHPKGKIRTIPESPQTIKAMRTRATSQCGITKKKFLNISSSWAWQRFHPTSSFQILRTSSSKRHTSTRQHMFDIFWSCCECLNLILVEWRILLQKIILITREPRYSYLSEVGRSFRPHKRRAKMADRFPVRNLWRKGMSTVHRLCCWIPLDTVGYRWIRLVCFKFSRQQPGCGCSSQAMSSSNKLEISKRPRS